MTEHIIIPINYIERKPNSLKYRVINKGVTVEFLSTLIDDPKWPVERICEGYNLTPAEVHAAWAFYYDHKEEIDRRLAEETAQFDKYSADTEQQKKAMLKRYEERAGHTYRPSDVDSY